MKVARRSKQTRLKLNKKVKRENLSVKMMAKKVLFKQNYFTWIFLEANKPEGEIQVVIKERLYILRAEILTILLDSLIAMVQ